jgi:putative CocE/NonD family hydrolase
MKGIQNGILDRPAVRYYVIGAVDEEGAAGNVWKTAESWPPPATATPFYLQGDGTLSQSTGAADSFTYLYDPEHPVPTRGGSNLLISRGPYDQQPVEHRDDVLLFTSAPLTSPLEIAGQISATLYVSAETVDTDFTVKVTDVYPDGRSMLVGDSVLRMRKREGADKEVYIQGNVVYKVDVEVGNMAYAFNTGHSIRVAISSSNSPRFKVNPNISDMFDLENGIPTDNTLYVGGSNLSYLELPVVSSSARTGKQGTSERNRKSSQVLNRRAQN